MVCAPAEKPNTVIVLIEDYLWCRSSIKASSAAKDVMLGAEATLPAPPAIQLLQVHTMLPGWAAGAPGVSQREALLAATWKRGAMIRVSESRPADCAAKMAALKVLFASRGWPWRAIRAAVGAEGLGVGWEV